MSTTQVHLAKTVPTTVTAPAPTGPSIPYTFTGTLSTTTSPSITPRYTTVFTGLSATLGTAGTSDTVVVLMKNGASTGDLVTIPAGSTYVRKTFPTPVTIEALTDSYGISITSAGASAANLGGELETQ